MKRNEIGGETTDKGGKRRKEKGKQKEWEKEWNRRKTAGKGKKMKKIINNMKKGWNGHIWYEKEKKKKNLERERNVEKVKEYESRTVKGCH